MSQIKIRSVSTTVFDVYDDTGRCVTLTEEDFFDNIISLIETADWLTTLTFSNRLNKALQTRKDKQKANAEAERQREHDKMNTPC